MDKLDIDLLSIAPYVKQFCNALYMYLKLWIN